MGFSLFIESTMEICHISPFLSCPWRGTLPPGEGMVRADVGIGPYGGKKAWARIGRYAPMGDFD